MKTSQDATMPGMFITAFLIAGGSKTSTSLSRDFIGFMSSAEKARQEAKKMKKKEL